MEPLPSYLDFDPSIFSAKTIYKLLWIVGYIYIVYASLGVNVMRI